MGALKEVCQETKEIFIDVDDNQPVGNCGDGVSVNTKAARLLSKLYGFTTPSLRCSSHACDGTLKRLARLKTMCVDEVKELYESLAPMIKHLSYSVKNKDAFERAMETSGRTPQHLLSWCGTHMAHFLDACELFN